jgi:formate dehydrogenase subunit delta
VDSSSKPVVPSGAGVRHEPRSKVPDLIRMVNQISANFAHHPPDQAAGEVAAHLTLFWSPAMRAELAAWVRAGGEDLHPLAVEAVRRSSQVSD